MNKKIIFIIGTARAGTKSIAHTLGKVPGVQAFHSYESVSGKYNRDPESLRLEKEDYLHREDALEYPIGVIIQKKLAFVHQVLSDGYHYVEAAGHYTTFVKQLVEVFPDCYIIHLIRDGRDVARSGIRRGWYGPNDKKWEWRWQRWEPPKNCYERFSKICWLWQAQNMRIYNDIQQLRTEGRLKDKYFEFDEQKYGLLHLEDIMNEDIGWLIEHLGIGYMELKFGHYNKSSKFTIPHWKEWNDDMVNKAKKWMGEGLSVFGYKW